MGCSSSTNAGARSEAARARALSLQVGELDQHETLDVRTLTMLMWKARDSPELLEVLSDLVSAQSAEKAVFDGVEFYLPQIAHMVIHLESRIGSSTLEAFALLVSQLSLHFALQLYWILVAAMEDYQPELADGQWNPTSDTELYMRCASLLHKVEKSVVFGSPRCPVFEDLFTKGLLTRDELQEIEMADRRFMAAQIAEAEDDDRVVSGTLGYKRWIRQGRFQTKGWLERYFIVQQRVLLCYRAKDMSLKRAIPLQHTTVTVKEHHLHRYYFELAETKRQRVYKLYAKSRAEMDLWVNILRQQAAAPPSYQLADFDMSTLTPPQVARYGFFRSESEFVRGLTDLCEEMRFVDIPDRKRVLLEKLTKLQVPGCVYLPLTRSTDVWKRVVVCREKEAHPFSTRERCPCLLTFEVATEGPSDIDVANYLYMALGLGATVKASDQEEDDDLDESLDALEAESNASHNGLDGGAFLNQREAWRLKFIESARQSVSELTGLGVGATGSVSSGDGGSIASTSDRPTIEDVTEGEEGTEIESEREKEKEALPAGVGVVGLDVGGKDVGASEVGVKMPAEEASEGSGAEGSRPNSTGSVVKRNKRLSNVAAFQSTRKMVESARGAAMNAKKGATHAVERVKHRVAPHRRSSSKRTNNITTQRPNHSIWDKDTTVPIASDTSATAGAVRATQQPSAAGVGVGSSTATRSLETRKKERRIMYKRRALDLIHSRTGKNRKANDFQDPVNEVGDQHSACDSPVPATTAEGEASTSAETPTTSKERGPFLSSLGRPAQRRKHGNVDRATSASSLTDGDVDPAALAVTESNEEVRRRVRTESKAAENTEGWDIARVIAKSNDDLRQEVFVMQLISLMRDVWLDAGLSLYLYPYRILSTSKDCGMLEVVHDAMSLDGFKKQHKGISLLTHFTNIYGKNTVEFKRAQRHFACSLAGYSAATYILGIKDRHNGNLMLNKEGALVHIDFGFVFGMAPGKGKVLNLNFSMERAAYKITNEMVMLMGGKQSDLYLEFEQMVVDGVLELRKHTDTLLTLVEIMGYKSQYPCFNQGGGGADGVNRVLRELKQRLMLDCNDQKCVIRMRKKMKQARTSRGTVLYEKFQKWSNDIEPIY